MSTGVDIPWKVAEKAARELEMLLGPFCRRLERAGSLRRLDHWIHDLEFLADPDFEPDPLDMFGENQVSKLHPKLDLLVRTGIIQHDPDHDKWGMRYRRFLYEGIKVDFFMCLPPAEFGVLHLIRTGPAQFSKRFMSSISDGGTLPMGFKCEDGRLLDRNVPKFTPDERDVFALLGKAYIEPKDRR